MTFDLAIRSNCSFPRETHAQMLYSASVLVLQIVGFVRTASRARFATRPKSTRKRSVRRRRSFRKAFVPQISLLCKKSVMCSALFLVSRICSNSSFLTLARHRRSNCRFLEEIRVKRAPLGVVARSAGSSVPQICSFRQNTVTASAPLRDASVSLRNPQENVPTSIVARSAGSSVPRICSFRQNTVTASAPLLDASVSLRNMHEKSSTRRRRSFLCFPYFFVNLVRLCSSQRDVDKRAPISLAPTLTAHSSGATFDARVVD